MILIVCCRFAVEIVKPPPAAVVVAAIFSNANLPAIEPAAAAVESEKPKHRRRSSNDEGVARQSSAEPAEEAGDAKHSGKKATKPKKQKKSDAEREAWLKRVRDTDGEAKAVAGLNIARKTTRFQKKFEKFEKGLAFQRTLIIHTLHVFLQR